MRLNEKIILHLNPKVYPLEAIYSTAYVFLDKVYVFLDGDPKKEIIVYLKPKEKMEKEKLKKLEGEFHNELLNYLLRVKIAKSNKKVRDFIVGTALVSALPNKGDSYLEDPLGISIPWQEKEKNKKRTKK